MRRLLAILAVCVVAFGLGIAATALLHSPLVAVAAFAAGVMVPGSLDERPREVRRERRSRGQCVGSGYDLTGNVSGVCPECGAAKA